MSVKIPVYVENFPSINGEESRDRVFSYPGGNTDYIDPVATPEAALNIPVNEDGFELKGLLIYYGTSAVVGQRDVLLTSRDNQTNTVNRMYYRSPSIPEFANNYLAFLPGSGAGQTTYTGSDGAKNTLTTVSIARHRWQQDTLWSVLIYGAQAGDRWQAKLMLGR